MPKSEHLLTRKSTIDPVSMSSLSRAWYANSPSVREGRDY